VLQVNISVFHADATVRKFWTEVQFFEHGHMLRLATRAENEHSNLNFESKWTNMENRRQFSTADSMMQTKPPDCSRRSNWSQIQNSRAVLQCSESYEIEDWCFLSLAEVRSYPVIVGVKWFSYHLRFMAHSERSTVGRPIATTDTRRCICTCTTVVRIKQPARINGTGMLTVLFENFL